MQRFALVKTILIATSLWVFSLSAKADLAIPGADGSDGAFVPTANIQVDLSQAVTAAWNTSGSGKGVYDAGKWAVVFKYSSVNIPSGVTVTFKNHPSRAPVVWLVSGNVNIAGTVALDGQSYASPYESEPGPGGFRGGVGNAGSDWYAAGGFGPGGGCCNNGYLIAGGYGTDGYANPNSTYGNLRILPLIGGSGGSGDPSIGYSGGAGAGAILIAAQGTITLNGYIHAQGGNRYQRNDWRGLVSASGDGSGGAVRLIANALTGTGSIAAQGGNTAGGLGRIRLETLNASGNTIRTDPITDAVQPDNPVLLWPPATAPSVRVVSIGGVSAPADPVARLDPGTTDVKLNNMDNAAIVLEAQNVQPTATVTVRIVPQYGAPSKVTATFSNGTNALSTWTANAVLPQGFFVVQARAENPPPQ